MVKAADALAEAGYTVRLVSVDYIDGAAGADADVVGRRQWRWVRVPVSRSTHPVRSRLISARHRASRRIAAIAGPQHAGYTAVTRAYGRTHPELVQAIQEEPFDFVYGGTSGALAAVAESARRARTRYALDLEDLHTAESRAEDASLTHALARTILRRVLGAAAFVTTASSPMAVAFAREFAVTPMVLLNVCDRRDGCSAMQADARPLELAWFSQTIGPRRGLEDVVVAAGRADLAASLHLRGLVSQDYLDSLRRLAATHAPGLEIVVQAPLPPDALVAATSRHHVGLAVEIGDVPNSELCVSNKLLTYVAAGLPLIATATVGQQSLGPELEGAVEWYPPGDVAQLARILKKWNDDRSALSRAAEASARAFRRRLHWAHPAESGALVAAVDHALASCHPSASR